MKRKNLLDILILNLSCLFFLTLSCTPTPKTTPTEILPDQTEEEVITASATTDIIAEQSTNTVQPPSIQKTQKTAITPSDDPWMISLENYNQVTMLERLGGMPVGGISNVTWSGDGEWLLVEGSVGTALLDAETLALKWSERRGQVTSFSSDSSLFYYMSIFDEEIEVRRVPDGELERVITLEKIPMTYRTTNMEGEVLDEVTRIALNASDFILSPDTSTMAGLNDSNRLVLFWDLESGKNAAIIDYSKLVETEYDSVSKTAFSADGSNLYLGLATGMVLRVNLETSQVTRILNSEYKITIEGEPRERHCEMFSNNGQTMAAFCVRYVGDPETDQIISTTFVIKLVDTNSAQVIQKSFMPNEPYLMVGFIPGAKQAVIYSGDSYEILDTSSGEIIGAAASLCLGQNSFFAPLGVNRMASTGIAGKDGKLDICDLSNGKSVVSLEQEHLPLTSTAIGRSGDTYLIATGDCSGEVVFWDPRNGIKMDSMLAHEGCIRSMAFSADGHFLVTGGGDKKVAFWDATNPGSDALITYAHPETIIDVAISYDGDIIASISKSQLQVWSTTTGENLQTKKVNEVVAVTLGPGGWLSYADYDIIYWDDEYHPGAMYLPDMGRLVTNAGINTLVFNDKWNEKILFLDTKTETLLNEITIKSYMPYLEKIAFTPDGCMLVGVYESHSFDFWRTSGFEQLEDSVYSRISEDDYDHHINDAAISHDGHLIILANADGSAQVWGVPGALEAPAGSGVPLTTCSEVKFPTPTPEPTATPIPPTATPVAFTRNLFLNDPPMVGNDVLALQKRLNELGYYEAGIPDGIFGQKTDEAVRNYQRDNGLVVDGIVGPITWEKLFSSTD